MRSLGRVGIRAQSFSRNEPLSRCIILLLLLDLAEKGNWIIEGAPLHVFQNVMECATRVHECYGMTGEDVIVGLHCKTSPRSHDKLFSNGSLYRPKCPGFTCCNVQKQGWCGGVLLWEKKWTMLKNLYPHSYDPFQSCIVNCPILLSQSVRYRQTTY